MEFRLAVSIARAFPLCLPERTHATLRGKQLEKAQKLLRRLRLSPLLQ